MVLMTVSDYESFYLITVLLDICEIRDDYVYSEHLIFGECETAVDNEYLIVALDQSAVFAYFFHSAQRYYPERSLCIIVFPFS